MRKKSLFLVSFILIVTLCMTCFSACSRQKRELRFRDYLYTVDNHEVTITKYNGDDEHIAVPESINGMPVVAIGDSAFHGCSGIKSLIIPDSVVKIGSSAFGKCYDLEHVTLGRGIREIDFYPFSSCRKISYNKYKGGNYIGNDENPYLALVSMTSTNIETVNIHPDTIVICGSAIKSCSLLREIVFPEGVLSIGSFNLQYCESLERVYIPKSVESIGLLVFDNCNSIQEITVSEENPHFKSVDGSLFSRDGKRLIKYATAREISSYCIPEGTVIIEGSAFKNATNLTNLVIPDSVEEIEHSAFWKCENIQSIEFGNGLKIIGACAFGSCTSLTTITIPDCVEELSYSAFSYCENLKSVVIGSGVVTLGDGAFSGCSSLSEAVFRDPIGWKVKMRFQFFSTDLDLSDPKQNAYYLSDKYADDYHYWYKK